MPAARISLPGTRGRSRAAAKRKLPRPRRSRQVAAPVPMPKAKPAAPVQAAAARRSPRREAGASRASRQASIRSRARPSRSERRDQFARLLEGPAGSADRDVGRAPHGDRVRRSAGRLPPSRRPPTTTGSVGPWTKDMPGEVATAFASASEPQSRTAARARRAGRRRHQQRHSAQCGGRRRHHRRAQEHAAAPARNPDRTCLRLAAGHRPRRGRALAARYHRDAERAGLHDNHVAGRRRYARAAAAAAQARHRC